MYKAPKLKETFIEVDANDNFLREMREAAGNNGAHPTTLSRAYPLGGEEAQFNKSRFFMIFTGAADNDQGGKPNAAQAEVLQRWRAKQFPDRESWEISQKVAAHMADGTPAKAPAEPYEAYAQSTLD